nr:glycine-rich protein 3 [Helicoverpa armigera]
MKTYVLLALLALLGLSASDSINRQLAARRYYGNGDIVYDPELENRFGIGGYIGGHIGGYVGAHGGGGFGGQGRGYMGAYGGPYGR